MAGEVNEIRDGAAVFPLIPEELGVNPLLLGVLHAMIFLAGSDDKLVDPTAADEAVQYIAGYLRRLTGDSLMRVQEDMGCLVSYAKQQKWPKQVVRALQGFLDDCEVTGEGTA